MYSRRRSGFGNRRVITSSAGFPGLGQWEWIGPAISAAAGIGSNIFGADQARKQQHDAEDTALKIAQMQSQAAMLPIAPITYPVAPLTPPINYYPSTAAPNYSKLLVYGGLGFVGLLTLLMMVRR